MLLVLVASAVVVFVVAVVVVVILCLQLDAEVVCDNPHQGVDPNQPEKLKNEAAHTYEEKKQSIKDISCYFSFRCECKITIWEYFDIYVTSKFDLKTKTVNWNSYYLENPFKESGLALYNWSPIADELKKLDKDIVLNSIKLKWNLVENEFKDLTKDLNFN